MSNFHQIWRNSSDGCPLWTAVARPPEVQLTWVLFLWLANVKLIIWGFWIFANLHYRPEICAFENGLTKFDPGPFSTARRFPADDFRHWKCLKRSIKAWLIRVQSSLNMTYRKIKIQVFGHVQWAQFAGWHKPVNPDLSQTKLALIVHKSRDMV